MKLFQLQLHNITAGVVTDEAGKIVKSAPICRWMLGKDVGFCAAWVRAKGGELFAVGPDLVPGPKSSSGESSQVID